MSQKCATCKRWTATGIFDRGDCTFDLPTPWPESVERIQTHSWQGIECLCYQEKVDVQPERKVI